MTIYTDNILFIHIPKTAGTSVINEIKKSRTVYHVANDRTKNDNYHSTAKDCFTSVPQIQKLYKFTIVRNPWDRACSWYFFRKKIVEKEINRLKVGKKSKKLANNLQDLKLEMLFLNSGFNDWLSKYIYSTWDFTWFSLSHDQHTWLDGIELDKIFKFENLYEELKSIDVLNLSNLKHMRKSLNNKNDFRLIYNKDSIDLIEKIYKKDIKKFGFKFE